MTTLYKIISKLRTTFFISIFAVTLYKKQEQKKNNKNTQKKKKILLERKTNLHDNATQPFNRSTINL